MTPQPKVANRVANQLMREIAERGLVTGDSLGAEHELIERLGVARGSLREGLRLLEALGVVELRRGSGGGVRISKPEPQMLVAPLAMLLQFEGGNLATVIEAVAAIEPTVAALAAQRRNDEHLDQLRHCVADLRRSVGDDTTYRQANRRFHDIVSDASGNALLGVLMPALSWMSSTIGWDIAPSRRRRVALQKEGILEAIERRDSLAASERTRAMLLDAQRVGEGGVTGVHDRVVWAHLNELLQDEQRAERRN
jgi:DNA-binding FadR family transcriptional regulator